MMFLRFLGLDESERKVGIIMGCFTSTDVEVGGIHTPPCAVDLGRAIYTDLGLL